MDFFLVIRPAIAALSGVINFPADEMEDVLEPGADLGRGGVDSGCLLRLPDRLGVVISVSPGVTGGGRVGAISMSMTLPDRPRCAMGGDLGCGGVLVYRGGLVCCGVEGMGVCCSGECLGGGGCMCALVWFGGSDGKYMGEGEPKLFGTIWVTKVMRLVICWFVITCCCLKDSACCFMNSSIILVCIDIIDCMSETIVLMSADIALLEATLFGAIDGVSVSGAVWMVSLVESSCGNVSASSRSK